MSSFRIRFDFHEEIIDKNGDFLAEYGYNLPHYKEIKKQLESSFNNIFGNQEENPLSKYFDEPLASIVDKGSLKCFQSSDGKAYGIATIELKPHNFLSENRKNQFVDWFDAQMCDGWGEGTFGVNMFEDDGLCVCVETGSSMEYGKSLDELRTELENSDIEI